jgi:hypothetical protein
MAVPSQGSGLRYNESHKKRSGIDPRHRIFQIVVDRE